MIRHKKTMILLFVCLLFITYAASSHVHAAPSSAVKSSSTSNQFGGAPFDPEQTMGEYNNKLKVQEKGDYTIVTWKTVSSKYGQRLYMSVAKNNKWLFRGKELLTINDSDDGSSKSIVVANNYIFYGDKGSLQVTTINLEDGQIASQKTLHTWEIPADSFSMRKSYFPIKTNDRSGVIYEVEEGKYEIFLEGELSKPLIIDDPKTVIKRQIAGDIILTSKRDRLIFIGALTTTAFNIKKKDMLYDSRGDQLVYRNISSYDNGKFYSYNLNRLSSIQTLDENFKAGSSLSFKIPGISIDGSAGVTVKNNVMRFWRYNSYQGTNSLQVTSFNLGK